MWPAIFFSLLSTVGLDHSYPERKLGFQEHGQEPHSAGLGPVLVLCSISGPFYIKDQDCPALDLNFAPEAESRGGTEVICPKQRATKQEDPRPSRGQSQPYKGEIETCIGRVNREPGETWS